MLVDLSTVARRAKVDSQIEISEYIGCLPIRHKRGTSPVGRPWRFDVVIEFADESRAISSRSI